MPTFSLSKVVKKVGDGVCDSYYLEVSAVGKQATMSRWVVANEYICAQLGIYIGLPIPPCALFEPKGTAPTVWFGSLN